MKWIKFDAVVAKTTRRALDEKDLFPGWVSNVKLEIPVIGVLSSLSK